MGGKLHNNPFSFFTASSSDPDCSTMLSPSFECVLVNTQPTERSNSTYIQPQPIGRVSEYVIGGFEPNAVREYDVSEYVVGQAGNNTNNDNTRTATTAVTESTTAITTTTAVALATPAPSTNRPSTSNATTSSSTTPGHRSTVPHPPPPPDHHSSHHNRSRSTRAPHPHESAGSSTVVPPPEFLILRCYSMEKHPKLSRSAIRDAVYGGKISLPPSFISHLQYIYAFYTLKIVYYKITPLAQPSLKEIDEKPSRVFCGALDYESPEDQCYLPPWVGTTFFLIFNLLWSFHLLSD
ncbi:unnamed protein product [Meloidogyne enterolobii]|uniref:Uncharacterized protein n=1 Tax=Meloidogyne enterolobii TaxID=390850 RepID=A0ACB0ZF17_MELEN